MKVLRSLEELKKIKINVIEGKSAFIIPLDSFNDTKQTPIKQGKVKPKPFPERRSTLIEIEDSGA